MKNYSTGLATKEKILEVCKDLFCEKGYRGAKYAEICEICQVNPGTITYHFNSKKNIAAILFNEMMDLFYKKTAELFPNEDDLQQVIIAAGMHQKLIFNDMVYRRFSSQYSSDSINKEDLRDYTEHVTKAYEVTLERVGQKKADFLFVAYKGMDCYIEPYIDEHIDELAFEEIFEYIASIYYQFVDSDELKERISRALDHLNGLDITFDRFNISIHQV